MYHPAIIVAYYLDPRYHGQALSEEYSFSTIAKEASQFVNQNLNQKEKVSKEITMFISIREYVIRN